MPNESLAPRKFRYRYFINWDLQGRLALGVTGAAVFSFVLVFLDYYFSFGRNAGWSADMLEVFLISQKMPLIQLVVFVFALAIVSVLLSHRVAGPLVNLKKSLKCLEEGDLTHHLFLRPNDQLKDVQDSYNRAVGSLKQKITKDRAISQDLRQEIENLCKDPTLSSDARVRLINLLQILTPQTQGFKLK